MKIRSLMWAVGGLFFSSAAFAEGGDAAASGSVGMVALASGLAMGLAALGAATGQGNAAKGALEGIARNPGAKDAVFMPMIIALAMMEFQALMGFIIAFMWYSK